MKTFKDLFIYLSASVYQKNNTLMYNQSSTESFSKISFDTFLEITAGYIKLLESLNLKYGDRVCMIGISSTHWLAADFAIMCCGYVCVPLFANSSEANLKFQIEQTQPAAFFVQNFSCKKKLASIGIGENHKNIFYFNDTKPTKLNGVIDLVNKIKISPDCLASIVYTSGTTGLPNGAMISHNNLVSQIINAAKFFDVNSTDTAISFLPTTHIFQRMICYLYIYKQVNIYFINDYTTLVDNFKIIKPTLLTTVPRVLEKVYVKIIKSVETKKGFAKLIAGFAFKFANGTNPNKKTAFFNSAINKLYSRLVFAKILAVFGGRIRMVICGGAKLNDEVYRFFCNISLPLYQGYGMTEMSPVIASNNPSSNKCYTVGKFFDNISYKILSDGELLVRGENLMLGYYKNEEETKKRIVDGYLSTGDIVEIDSDGFLIVKSRKKEIFKTSNGKYVDPNKIEFLISKHNEIEYSCIIADGKNFVSAILFTKLEDAKQIDKIISDVNLKLDHHEQIVKYYVSDDFLSPETGELTPSLKLRRFIIYEKYKNKIDSFYNNDN